MLPLNAVLEIDDIHRTAAQVLIEHAPLYDGMEPLCNKARCQHNLGHIKAWHNCAHTISQLSNVYTPRFSSASMANDSIMRPHQPSYTCRQFYCHELPMDHYQFTLLVV